MSRTAHALRVTLAAAAIAAAATARAQFPITESFTGPISPPPGWTLLGDAVLTASPSGGSLDAPGEGWLRLTSATGNQAGSAIFNTAFASTSGIAITFDYADYGNTSATGADGFTFYLIDGATTTPTVGAYGGPLGYAGRYGNITTTRCASGTMSVTTPGVTNGYVGVGFDEFGNFSNCESGWNALSTTTQQPQAVVIRGSGSGSVARSFKYLTSQRVNVAPFNSTIDGATRAAPRKARVSIVNRRITVAIDFGAGYQTVIDAYDLAADANQAPLPATFKMGLSGSTGGSNNVHEIRNVRVELPANLALSQSVTPTTVGVGGTLTWTITVTNDATNDASGAVLADTFPAGLTGVTWTATTTGGAVLARASGTGDLAEAITTFPKNASVTWTVTATVGPAAAGQVLTNTVTLAPPSGVANLLSNTSATAVTVERMATTTALASSATPSRLGQPVTLTATVTAPAPGGGTPAGTVTFLDGATALGTAALDGTGRAALTTSALAVGTHAVTASYGGSASYRASASSALAQEVAQALTTTALAAAPVPSVAGQPVLLTAAVAASAPGAGTPGGAVTFLDGATALGTAALDGAGLATLSTAALAVGSHALSASYAGATGFAASASAPLAHQVDRAAAAAAVASSAAPSRVGQPVTFTAALAAVAPGAGTPGGTVTFLDGAAVLGAAALDAAGTATLTTSSLAAGAHAITVAYPGDARFLGATSAPLAQQVDPAATATAVVASDAATVTGQPVTFTATVSTLAPGAGLAVGQVAFLDGATPLGTAALDAGGTATLTTSALAAGAHAVTAAYAGSASHLGSASAPLGHQVDRAATGLSLAALGPTPVTGEPRTFTATVTAAAPGAGVPGGTVTFAEGAAVLGSAPLDAAGTASLAIALPAGAHTLTATYGGSADFLGSAGTVAAPAGQAATAVSLLAGPSPALVGEAVLLEAAVTVAAPGAGTPGGTVTFLDGVSVLGTAPLDGAGRATLPVSALAVGAHALTAVYGGDAGFLGAGSPAADVAVVPAPTSTVLASSLLTATFGDPLTLDADVAVAAPGAGVPSGTVRFFADGAPLGDAALDAAGRATLLVPGGALPAGAHQLTAAYLGDGAFEPSTSADLTQAVARAATAVAVAGAGASLGGEPTAFRATVSFPEGLRPPGGTVSFFDGATFLGAAPLDAAGVAVLTVAALAPGEHGVTATYAGDADYAGASSAPAAHRIDPTPTATALAAPAPSTFGEPVTLRATVSVPAFGLGAPTGAVTFLDGAAVLGTGAVDAAGVATLPVSTLAGGGHALSARYDGDAAFAPSSSPPLDHQVGAAATALALTTSGSPSRLGEPIALTAAVTSAAGTPAGPVTFRDGATVLGAAALDGAGVASLTLPGLALGAHALAADFAGTADFAASSGAATQVVVQGAADVALAALPAPAVTGEPVTLTVLVTARAPATGTPGGAVRLLDGGAPLGSAALAGGVATFTTAGLAVGVHALTAEYDGDEGFLAGATAAPTLLAIDPAATATALAASAPASAFTEPVTLTATVTVLLPGAGQPAGTVTFSEGTEILGTAAVQPDGTAALSLPALPAGPHALVATYGGEPAFALSVSDPVHHEVSLAAAAVAVTASPAPSRAGEPVTVMVTATPVAPALGPVAGSVTLRDGATVLGTAALDAAGAATFTTATLGVGAHLLSADLAGAGFADATSPGLAHQVDPAATATAVAAAPHPALFGQDVTLTATVSVLAPGDAPLASTVDFTLDGAPAGSAALAGGQATLVLPGGRVPAGLHLVAARYGGGAATEASSSPVADLLVSAAPSSLVLAALPSAPVAGQPVVLRAEATSAVGTPAGTVAFTVDGQPLPPVALDAAGLAELPIGPLAAGTHAIEVRFPGSGDFGEAAAAGALVVAPAASATTLVADRAGALAGQPVTFTATVTVPAPGAGQPAGQVTFLEGATVLGTAALDAAGQATVSLATLAPGAHAVTASFPGTADLSPSSSGPAAVTVSAAPTALSLAAAPDAPVAGQPVTLTATVTVPAPGAGQPAGLVTFTDGTAVLGTAALGDDGRATLTTAALATGAHALSASWPGDAALLGAAGGAPLQVFPAASATTLLALPGAAVTGQPVVLTASVAAVAPGAAPATGLVTFLEGAAVLGSAALDAAGQASLSLATLAPGAHAVTAAFPGTGDLAASASAPAAVAIGPAATTLVLSASPSPSVAGQPVALTAQVAVTTPGAGAPAGTVTFSDGATVLGAAALDGSGRATLTVAALPVGDRALGATWPGDAGLQGSHGAAAHAVAVSPTTTLVSATPADPTFGQAVTITATVAPAGGGAGAPGGTVTFLDGATVLGTAPVGADGTASLAVATLGAGHHEITAAYGGDATFAGSGSATAAAVEVARAASQVALQASPSPATAGQAVTLTAAVGSSGGTPGGTVTFLDATTVLGTVPVGADGTAALVVTLAAGEHALTAEASGDAGHLPATGGAALTVEKAASQVAVATSRTPSRAGRPVTFTATVAAAADGGTVRFWDDSGAAPVLLGSAPAAGGAATLTTRGLGKGTHAIRAEYLGTDVAAPATGTLPGGQVIENTPPVAGAGTALSLGGAAAPGSAARATVAVAGSPVDAAQGTVELWLRPTWTAPAQAGTTPVAARLGGADAPRWSLGVLGDRRGVVVTVGAVATVVPASLDDLAWHHLALVGGAAGTTLLLDGAEVGAVDEPFGAAAADELVLGEGFVGELDELRTWSTARTAAQLADAARRPLTGAEAGLTGLWRFDDGAGLDLLDAGPGHLDGAITLVDPAAAPAPFAPSQAWRDRQVASGAAMAPAAAGYDADGDPLTLALAVAPAHGAATVDEAGLQVGYASAPGFDGQDGLTFTLSDGEATSDYTLAIAVAAPATCTATAQCGGGTVCIQGACVPDRDLDVRAGGCGCGNAGGGALALWSVLSLALLRRRRPAARRSP